VIHVAKAIAVPLTFITTDLELPATSYDRSGGDIQCGFLDEILPRFLGASLRIKDIAISEFVLLASLDCLRPRSTIGWSPIEV